MSAKNKLAISTPAKGLPEIKPVELEPEDFYYEGPYLVFTAAYHLKRGYCCNSDCRHCPFRETGSLASGR